MKYSDIYVGLKVRANSKEAHERCPKYYPRKGTKGVVTSIDSLNIWVQWKKGTTTLNDKWVVCYDFIEPAKGYWWRKWKKIFAKSKK